MTQFKYNDGGRSAVFDTPGHNDCVTRSIAIMTGLPYIEVWNGVHATGTVTRTGRVMTTHPSFEDYVKSIGLVYVPVHEVFNRVVFPARVVACMRGHYFAVIDGVIHDTYNPTATGRAIIRGYWMAKPAAAQMFNVCNPITSAPINAAPLNLAQAETMARLLLLNYKRHTKILPHEQN